MNDRRIDAMLRKHSSTKNIWKGFLAPDIKLQNEPKPPFPHLYFVNNAPTETGGEHWCVLFVFENHCEFFDSFGRSPMENNVLFSILNHCSNILFNNVQYQNFYSQTCGHHCLFFSILRASGFSCKQIKGMYKENDFIFNDDLVFSFVWKLFGKFFAQIEEM